MALDKRALQQDEALVLQSSFGPDVISLKTENCWKQWAPMEVCIRLSRATEKSKATHVSVNLLFQCTESYPHSPPKMKVDDSDGLTATELKSLLDMLDGKAITLVGNPMIFELCSLCLEYLEKLDKLDHSVHQTMMLHQELIKNEQNRIRADSVKREQVEVELEHERRKNEAENKRQQEELERQNRAKVVNLGDIGNFIAVKTIAGDDTKVYKKTTTLRRKPFHRFCTEWNGVSSSRELLVSEWSFVHTLGRKQGMRREVDLKPFLDKMDAFFNNVVSTLKALGETDQFLHPVVFVSLRKNAVEVSNFNVSLLIGQEIHSTDTCISEKFQFIQKNLESLVPPLASQAVCALKWLHDRQLTHGHFVSNSIWMTKKTSFRFSDALFLPELLQLCDLFERLTDSSKIGSPPSSPSNKSVRAKVAELQRKDLFALGTLLDSLTMKPMSTTEDEASDFTLTLHSFIKFCQSAKSVEQLVDHQFLSLHLLPINDSCSDDESVFGFSQMQHSRLAKDFYAFRPLGRGGFGQVVLARNKLDTNDYAVKVIPLNAENDQLIRKVTREANLLSKLNHEHVVRYFAAWIEVAGNSAPRAPMTSSSSSSVPRREIVDDSEVMLVNERSVAFVDDSEASTLESESSDDSSVGNGPGKLWQRPKNLTPMVHTIFSANNLHSKSGVNSEFDVIFDDEEDDSADDVVDGGDGDTSHSTLPKILYIQMEFCEKSTLRVLIDDEILLKDTAMNWRLFREILSGLKYIHNQGMIHRDIKPVNIFLDSQMSVKIGDFGLATLESFSRADGDTSDSGANINMAASHTKGIGTGLYIAPEVIQNTAFSTRGKTYDSRCDVYSVGIVLFEMFYRPLPIGMERMDVLQHLRNQLVFPDNFGGQLSSLVKKNVKQLIKWMIDLNPENRPTVRDLLQHELVPFVESEESDFQRKYKDNLRNRSSKLHQYVVNELFNLETPSAADYLYDLTRNHDPDLNLLKIQSGISHVTDKLKSVFSLHGYRELNTHAFTPVQQQKEQKVTLRNAPVSVIERSGFLMTVHKDLRTNFTRYLARNAIDHMKRYSIGKVLIEADVPGTCPIERCECSADIVGPADLSSRLAGDILSLVIDIGKQLPFLTGLKKSIRLGHMKLIESVCASNGCSDDQTLKQIQDLLYSMTSGNKRLTLDEKIERLNTGAEIGPVSATIMKLLEPVESLEELKAKIHRMLNHKSAEVSVPAKTAIDEIIQALAHLEIHTPDKLSIIFDPSIAYRPNMFTDGLVYLLEVELPFKGLMRKATILGGGRYDKFLYKNRHMKDQAVQQLSAYGVNISLEGLVSIQNALKADAVSGTCVLIYAATKHVEREVVEAIRKLRLRGIAATVYHGLKMSEDALLEYCKNNWIPYLMTADDNDKYVIYEDLALTKSSKMATYGEYAHGKYTKEAAISMMYSLETHDQIATPVHDLPTPNVESSRHSLPMSSTANFSNVSITLSMLEKTAHNHKKRIEKQIHTLLQEMIQNFNAKTKIDVFATELTADVITQIVGCVNRQFSEVELRREMQQLAAGKQKKDIELLEKNLSSHFSANNGYFNPIILYSVCDNSFKVIM